MTRKIIFGVLGILAAATVALADSPTPAAKPTPGHGDQKFVDAATQISLTEITLGKLVENHATSAAVKTFGQQMVSDHTAMNSELQKLAQQQGYTVAQTLDDKHQELVDQLAALHGADFDAAYTKDMVSGHEKAIKLFDNEAQNGNDPDLKAWASTTVKTLKMHLDHARQAAADISH